MKKIFIMIFIIFLMVIPVKAETSITALEKEVKEVLAKVSPSIVKVISQNHRNYYATGIVIDKDHVITNTIITKYPYRSIYIRSAAGDRYQAKIVGKDKNSSILILKIGKNSLIPINQAKKFEVGDWVGLVGAFYKKFPAINQGILSSVSEDEMILNAAVVPGISGGAVVNKKGELIGVIRGRFSFTLEPDYTFRDHNAEILLRSPRTRSKDLCVAVPVKKVTRVTDDLIKYGKIRKGWLGVTITTTGKNVTVEKVVEGSPAEKGGIRTGDIILSIDEKPMKNAADVVKVVRSLRPEQKSKIKIRRDEDEKLIVTTIAEAEAKDHNISFFTAPGLNQYSYSTSTGQVVTIPEKWQAMPKLENFIFNLSGARSLGIDMLSLTPELADEFMVKEGFGLLISKIYKKSAAEKAGLRVADIIVKVNDQYIKRITDLRQVLSKLGSGDKDVLLKLYRKGKIKEVKVLPDKSSGFGYLYDPFKSTREKIDVEIDEENVRSSHKELIELRGGYLIINGKKYDLDRVKEYNIELQKLRQERDKYKEEVKKLKKMLDREKDRKKKATI